MSLSKTSIYTVNINRINNEITGINKTVKDTIINLKKELNLNNNSFFSGWLLNNGGQALLSINYHKKMPEGVFIQIHFNIENNELIISTNVVFTNIINEENFNQINDRYLTFINDFNNVLKNKNKVLNVIKKIKNVDFYIKKKIKNKNHNQFEINFIKNNLTLDLIYSILKFNELNITQFIEKNMCKEKNNDNISIKYIVYSIYKDFFSFKEETIHLERYKENEKEIIKYTKNNMEISEEEANNFIKYSFCFENKPILSYEDINFFKLDYFYKISFECFSLFLKKYISQSKINDF
jgi:hypothetical protein